MAIHFPTAASYIKRITNIVAPSSQYTCVFWGRLVSGTNPPATTTLFATIHDPVATYDYFAGIFLDHGTDNSEVVVGDGISFPTTPTSPLTFGLWYPFAYTRSGTSHKFYVAGVLIGTATLDISAGTFDWLSLGSDTFDVDLTALEFCRFREWNTALAAFQINNEINSPLVAVHTANLVTDTPLISDLLDISGNGNDWTAVGSPTFVADPAFPTNISAATAQLLTIPSTITQDVNPTGTYAFETWYKFIPSVDQTLGFWAFGNLTGYSPGYDVYLNSTSVPYMGYSNLNSQGFNAKNLPFYLPVQAGQTYLFENEPQGLGNPNPAVITITLSVFPNTPLQAGDFINNREVDDSFEHPLTVITQTDYTVRAAVQLGTPIPGERVDGNLPHGDYGAILADGHFLYVDDAFFSGKIYDLSFNTIATIPPYPTGLNSNIVVGSNRTSAHFYILHRVGLVVGNTLNELDTNGVNTNTFTVTTASVEHLAVNDDASILYHGNGTTIHRWDIVNAIALSDLATVATGEVEDILYLEDGTILAVFLLGSSSPHQVVAKQWLPNGTLLNTYDFGTLWRQNLNPPRIGYAVDSPASFWIRLAPQSDFGIDILKNVRISDGAILSTVNQANFLFTQYIGAQSATPPALFGQEKAGALLVAPSTAPSGTIVVGKASNPLTTQVFTVTGPDGDFTIVSDTSPGEIITVAPGTYSIVETADSTYQPEYFVSNDPVNNNNLAIVVAADELVDVVIVNSLKTKFGGLYQLVNRTNDQLINQDGSLLLVKINWFFDLFIGRDK